MDEKTSTKEPKFFDDILQKDAADGTPSVEKKPLVTVSIGNESFGIDAMVPSLDDINTATSASQKQPFSMKDSFICPPLTVSVQELFPIKPNV